MSFLKSLRKKMGLPPITLGRVGGAVAVGGASIVGSPAAGAAVAAGIKAIGSMKQQQGGYKNVVGSLAKNFKVDVDPLTKKFTVRTSGELPNLADVADLGGGPSIVGLPSYYGWAALAGLVFLLALRGGGK